MKRNLICQIKNIVLVFGIVLASSCSNSHKNDFSERSKLALRDVGNKLLLSHNDSTSLILPVIELSPNKYQITFSNSLSFEPSTLVSFVKQSFRISKLPESYRVEVLQCGDKEVAYSYQMSNKAKNTIIPCSGRYLPNACYIIEIKFTNRIVGFTTIEVTFYSILLLIIIVVGFLFYKKKKSKLTLSENGLIEKIGSFYFYPEQHKLVKEAREIALSKKECELLALFAANPNQIIKRDELTKRVWEDNGVFVGRSLDTYISKLRKKLKSDASIKLTNIHSVGYKLEIEQ